MKKLILSTLILFTALAFSLGNAAPAENKTVVADRGSPPGLQGKGGAEFPRGLENQEKIPKGWSHGKKEGWEKGVGKHHHDHHHHHGHAHDQD